jgi:holin-like protein
MLQSLTILLLFQLIGEVITRALELPIPGPVIGMLLLFITLVIRGSAPDSLRETAQGLLRYLPLLFVPAGVGVMVHAALLQSEWLAILITLVGSTLITLVVTAVAIEVLRPRSR